MSGEALDAIFGIYVKNAAQRCVRELRTCSVALFPSIVVIMVVIIIINIAIVIIIIAVVIINLIIIRGWAGGW